MKFVTVIGARPQFIKAVSLSKIFLGRVEEIIIHTGQHYDSNMSDVFFDELEIPKPKYQFDLGGGSHAKQTGLMLMKIEEVLLNEKPDLVIVYGDTNSTLAGGLAASKLNIPVAHIEAGLRSFNRKMPEEVNRILTDHLAKFLFVPSEDAINQLKTEGIIENVYDVGDIMFDSILNFKELALKKSQILEKLYIEKNNYCVATMHRAENTDYKENLLNVFDALSNLDKKIVLPIHPRTKLKIKEYGIKLNETNLILIDPLGYLDMINLLINSYCILTDSGGIQKEAYYLNVPCITLREETEWKETVKIGWNVITGTNKNKILEAYKNLSKFANLEHPNLYGNGNTSEQIYNILINKV